MDNVGIIENIDNKVKSYLDGDYQIIDFNGIPQIYNVAFGKKAYKTSLITFSIDLRKSSQLLFDHPEKTAGKIHKAFLTVIVETIRHFGGHVRDFQGDSILAFWGAQKQGAIRNAVTAALGIRWLLTTKLKKHFEKYTTLDYGIGIALGEVYVLRAGIKQNPNNNDLVYIGKSVNFAVAIANQAKLPACIEVSRKLFKKLTEDLKYGADKSGNKEYMWEKNTVEWNDVKYATNRTWFHAIFS